MSQTVVLDNTVLSNLAKVDRTDLVTRIWGDTAYTTATVQSEFQAGVDRGILPSEAWKNLSVILLSDHEQEIADTLPRSLGAGERSCLAVAQHRGSTIVTDDLDARKAAGKLGLSATGTVGILGLCVKQKLLSLEEGNRLLDLMISHNYRAPVAKLEEIL